MRRCGARSESRAQNAEPPSPAPTTTTSTGSSLATLRSYAPPGLHEVFTQQCEGGFAVEPRSAITAHVTALREAVERVAREHLPADVAESWIGLLRPAARLEHANPGDRLVGQLGGVHALHEAAGLPNWCGHGPPPCASPLHCGRPGLLGLA